MLFLGIAAQLTELLTSYVLVTSLRIWELGLASPWCPRGRFPVKSELLMTDTGLDTGKSPEPLTTLCQRQLDDVSLAPPRC